MSGYYGDGTNRVNSFEPAGGARDISACFLDLTFPSHHSTDLLERDGLNPLHGVDVKHIHSVLTVH